MKYGDKVKVISKDYPRYGEIGMVIGKEMTPIGMLYRIRFEDKDALYAENRLRIVS